MKCSRTEPNRAAFIQKQTLYATCIVRSRSHSASNHPELLHFEICSSWYCGAWWEHIHIAPRMQARKDSDLVTQHMKENLTNTLEICQLRSTLKPPIQRTSAHQCLSKDRVATEPAFSFLQRLTTHLMEVSGQPFALPDHHTF